MNRKRVHLWTMNRLEKERESESSDDFDIFCNFVAVHSFLSSFRVPWKQAPGGWWWWWWCLLFRVFVLTPNWETWWVRDGWKLWLWLFIVAAVGLEPKEETKNLARKTCREREREREKAMDGRTDIRDVSRKKFRICAADVLNSRWKAKFTKKGSCFLFFSFLFFPSSEFLCEE